MRTILKWMAVPVLACAVGAAANASTIYVSSDSGIDSNVGNSATAPYKSLGKVAGAVNPSDTVLIMSGTYSPFKITRGGTSEVQRVTWKAFPGHTPDLISNGWNAIDLAASFQAIDGLVLIGNNDNVRLADADMLKSGGGSSWYNGHGQCQFPIARQ